VIDIARMQATAGGTVGQGLVFIGDVGAESRVRKVSTNPTAPSTGRRRWTSTRLVAFSASRNLSGILLPSPCSDRHWDTGR
jgi:hypothetical protein